MINKQNTLLTIFIFSMLTLSSCSTIKSWEEEARAKPTPKAINTKSAYNPFNANDMNKEDSPLRTPANWIDPNKLKPSQYEKYLQDSGNVLHDGGTPSHTKHK